jgi:hypothetical protein
VLSYTQFFSTRFVEADIGRDSFSGSSVKFEAGAE